jgi:hypothetical protein
MVPKNIATIAIISNKCIKLPTVVKNTPIAHPIIRITAITYNNEFMAV